jgi:hypothetical protein
MDGSALNQGDLIWHREMGQWRVKSVTETQAQIENEMGVKRRIFTANVSGDSREYGWHQPLVVWKKKDEPTWTRFVNIVNTLRGMIHE